MANNNSEKNTSSKAKRSLLPRLRQINGIIDGMCVDKILCGRVLKNYIQKNIDDVNELPSVGEELTNIVKNVISIFSFLETTRARYVDCKHRPTIEKTLNDVLDGHFIAKTIDLSSKKIADEDMLDILDIAMQHEHSVAGAGSYSHRIKDSQEADTSYSP